MTGRAGIEDMGIRMPSWRTLYEQGRLACRQGDLSAAAAAFAAALGQRWDHAGIHHDLGVVQYHQGRFARALESFRGALRIDSGLAPAWFNGGNALCALDRLEEAADWYRHAVARDPGAADAHYNLANVSKSLGAYEEAAAHYRQVLQIDPRMPDAHNNLGTLLLADGALDQALACFQRAVALNPAYGRAMYNQALALNRLGRPGEALDPLRHCLAIEPQNGEAAALLVSLLQQTCSWEELVQAEARLDRLTDEQLRRGHRPSESPFLHFTRSTDTRRNLLISQAWSQWLLQSIRRRPSFDYRRRCLAPRRLRIGYLSERFRNAATAHLLAGVFSRHDRQGFEVYAYSWGRDDGSVYRRKIERGADHFIDIRSLSDQEAARRVHADGIDILVDLMGWMHGHRMGISALKPAPVQVNYLGYPATSGAPFIDFILADRVVVPDEIRVDFSEKVIWLPDCYQANDPETPLDAAPIRRGDHGLPDKATVFCSFNTDYKIEALLFESWMRILRNVPDSVLWLIVRSPEARDNLCLAAGRSGIPAERLVFASPLPKPQHLARLQLADLALDTRTVNGHTTTSDALLAGVPVITCQGRNFASRVAGSILQAIGMEKLVASNIREYEALAVSLASDRRRLDALRATLEDNRRSFPLFDTDRYVRNLESAYRQMWAWFVERQTRRP